MWCPWLIRSVIDKIFFLNQVSWKAAPRRCNWDLQLAWLGKEATVFQARVYCTSSPDELILVSENSTASRVLHNKALTRPSIAKNAITHLICCRIIYNALEDDDVTTGDLSSSWMKPELCYQLVHYCKE